MYNTAIQPETGSCMKGKLSFARNLKIMAEDTDSLHGRHEMSSDVNLTPEDIPCSSVKNGEDISKWTIPQLKFWLKCRRLNQQGLKKDLVEK